ncbi:MAG: hypothetical protein LBI33_11430 [Propionibacteriaceae bacterium]|jgi:uncharacterized protein with PQ loop repeat|nr:hypothetical protein [Propionibacteriaceae bacterium]
MTLLAVLGWVAAATAMTIGLPQAVRLARTRNVAGLPLASWQGMLAINLGWSFHGTLIGAPNMVVTNLVGLVSTTVVLALMMKVCSLSLWRAFLPGIGLAAGIIAVDLWLGSAVFGIASLVPGLVNTVGQAVKLVHSPSVSGVSPGFLFLQLLNQILWSAWAVLRTDPGSQITSIGLGVVAAFNAVWWTLRRLGLRALFQPSSEPGEPAPVRAI